MNHNIMHLNMAFPPTHHGFVFQSQEDNNDHYHLPSPTSLPSCTPQLFHGGGGGPLMMMKRSMSFSGIDRCDQDQVVHNNNNGDDDLSDDGSQLLGEKKKRLNMEQVKALEKSFELGNKLEPERKIQLAKALGLHPRQIAIWFQNRRARCKTKQLEKDYEILKKQFDSLKADNDALQAQNKKLQAELMALKGGESNHEVVNLKRENEGSWNNGSENSTPDNNNLDLTRTTPQLTSKHLFPISSSSSIRPTSINQLLQGSSGRSDIQLAQDHDHQNLCNMFNAMDDHQQGYWTWPDHQHQQYH